MIDVKDIITLDNNKKYTVMAKTIIDEIEYYYLMDSNDYTNYKFCKLNSDETSFIEINDKETMNTLIKLFAKELRKELNTGE
jgi:hypothetical protein